MKTLSNTPDAISKRARDAELLEHMHHVEQMLLVVVMHGSRAAQAMWRQRLDAARYACRNIVEPEPVYHRAEQYELELEDDYSDLVPKGTI